MTQREMIDMLGYAKYSELLTKGYNTRMREPATVSYSDYYNYNNRNNYLRVYPLQIEKVVFNPPATIILWADKTKTVVKCQDGEPFDPEKGMTMAFMKKVYGNTGAFNKEINKWCKPYYEKEAAENYPELVHLVEASEKIKDSFNSMDEKLKKLKEAIDKMRLNKNKNESGDVDE